MAFLPDHILSNVYNVMTDPFWDLCILGIILSLLAIIIYLKQRVIQLRDSEKKFRNTIENATEGIIRTSREGKFIMANSAYAKMLGYDSPTDLMKSIKDIPVEIYVDPEIRKNFQQEVERNEKARCEYEAKRKDGSKVWVSASAHIVKDERGRFLYYESIVEDMTDRKMKELELQNMADTLKRSNEELDRFAHTVAHDIKQPLTSLLLCSEVLAQECKGKVSNETFRYTQHIEDTARRISAFVTDILKFSEASSKAFKPEQVDLNEVLSNVLEDLDASILAAKANINIQTLPVIWGDRVKLLRLFSNLISNSIKFKKPDLPLEIVIMASRIGNKAVISVRDNGVGFDSTEEQNVFNLFTRLKNSKDISGSGMGLAMCKRIVDLHGGNIWVKSQVGKGTMFSFSLPYASRTENIHELRDKVLELRSL